jgi:hypothetical protein
MPSVKVDITHRMAELLKSGRITIHADFYGSGDTVYARVVQPHPRLGLYPHETWKLDELQIQMEKVAIASEISASPFDGPSSERSPARKGTSVQVETRHDPDIGKVPTSITVNRVRNALPKSSLTFKDLAYLTDDQLNRRVQAIGKDYGPDKAVSKIESQGTGPKAPTLQKWWAKASPEKRFWLISTSKLAGKKPQSHEEYGRLLDRLGVGQYPFRGTDRDMEKSQEADTEEEEDELEVAFERGLRLYDSDDE